MLANFLRTAILSFIPCTLAAGLPFTNRPGATGPSSSVPASYGTPSSLPVPLQPASATNFRPTNTSLVSHFNGTNEVISGCDHEAYGSPSRNSCEDAFNQMGGGNILLEYGDRTHGRGWDVNLPYRYISGTCHPLTLQNKRSDFVLIH